MFQTHNLRRLIIGPKEKEKIAQALELARQKPLQFEAVKHLAMEPRPHLKLKDRPSGFRPKAEFVELPVGFLVAVSFEEQPRGLFTHLSISIDRKGKIPHPYAVSAIAKAFGLSGELPPEVGTTWLEEFEPGHSAINVLELANASILS